MSQNLLTASSMELSAQLREARAQRGFTQAQVSDELCISIKHISEIENGRSMPSVELLTRLADLYEVVFKITQ